VEKDQFLAGSAGVELSAAGIDCTGSPAASFAGAAFSAAGTEPTTTGTENVRASVCTLLTIRTITFA
jgi:hypothetical protein